MSRRKSWIEVANLKSGQLLNTWQRLSDLEKDIFHTTEYSLNNIFKDTGCDFVGVRRMISNQKKPMWHLSCPINTEISVLDTHFDPLRKTNLAIIYFINCFVSKNWEVVFRKHMNDLKASRICFFPGCTLKIVVNCEPEDLPKVIKIAGKFFRKNSNKDSKLCQELAANLQIIWTKEECFEYPGIKSVHEAAQSMADSDYLIYSHAKGISHIKDKTSKWFRLDSEIASKMILRNALINIDILDTIKSINKVGPGLGGSGWMWFNFYASRASYIKNLHQPQKTNYRHYYESWLGDFPAPTAGNCPPGNPKLGDGLSLSCIPIPTISTCFDPQVFWDYVNSNATVINNRLDESFECLLDALYNNDCH